MALCPRRARQPSAAPVLRDLSVPPMSELCGSAVAAFSSQAESEEPSNCLQREERVAHMNEHTAMSGKEQRASRDTQGRAGTGAPATAAIRRRLSCPQTGAHVSLGGHRPRLSS